MKKTGFLIFFMLSFAACGTIDQNLQARKQLANCQYDFETFELQEIGFAPLILINGKYLNFTEPSSAPVLIQNREQIQMKNFTVKLETVALDLFLKITNTTEHPVALDAVEGNLYLDGKKSARIEHKHFVRIEPGKFSIEKIFVSLPVEDLEAIDRKEVKEFSVEAAVQINILMGSFTLKTPFTVTVKKTFPMPYEKIDAKMDPVKEKVQEQLDSLKEKLPDAGELKDQAKKKLKKLF